jgi:hypothetical protein
MDPKIPAGTGQLLVTGLCLREGAARVAVARKSERREKITMMSCTRNQRKDASVARY